MPTYSIRELTFDEIESSFMDLVRYAFYPSLSMPPPTDWLPQDENNNYIIGASHGDQLVAIVELITIHQIIHQNIRKMRGIANIATQLEHRRHRLARMFLVNIFQKMHEQNTVSTLNPFKEFFYERLGYALLPSTPNIEFDPSRIKLDELFHENIDFERKRYKDVTNDVYSFFQSFHVLLHGLGTFEYQKENT